MTLLVKRSNAAYVTYNSLALVSPISHIYTYIYVYTTLCPRAYAYLWYIFTEFDCYWIHTIFESLTASRISGILIEQLYDERVLYVVP